MASYIEKMAKMIAEVIKDDKSKAYDTTATVTKVEGNTAWVHIPGGVDETPARMTINAKPGDAVQVRVSGGRAFLVGNGSAPPTDDKRAIIANNNAIAAGIAAESAIEDAERAHDAADRAQESADAAEVSATTANRAANGALLGLSTVQDVIGVLNWASENAQYQLTADTEVIPGKVYWTRTGAGTTADPYVYDPVATPVVADLGTYYEIASVDEAMAEYIESHLALTDAGLYVIKDGTAYLALFATDGMSIIDPQGNVVAKYGTAISIGTAANTKITLDTTNGLRLGDKIQIKPNGNANIGGWNVSNNFQIYSQDPVTEGTASTQYQVYMRSNQSGTVPATPTTHAFGVQHREYTGSSYGSWISDFNVRRNGEVTIGTKLNFTDTDGTVHGVLRQHNEDSSLGRAFSIENPSGNIFVEARSGKHVRICAGGRSNPPAEFRLTSADSSNSHGYVRLFCISSNGSVRGLYIDPDSGTPNNFYGAIVTSSAMGTGGKEAWNDTSNSGCWLSSTGEIHLSTSATKGGGIGFHYNFSASPTVSLSENESGVLTCSGQFLSKSYGDGTRRPPVNTALTDGKRIAYLACNTATQLAINGQWGTTGTTYSNCYVTVSASDIRLKDNIKDSTVQALPVIEAIRIREFDWKDGRHQAIGMVADEIEQLDPALTVGGGEEEDGTINYKSVDTFYLVGYLTKAVQELSAEITALRQEIADLKGR